MACKQPVRCSCNVEDSLWHMHALAQVQRSSQSAPLEESDCVLNHRFLCPLLFLELQGNVQVWQIQNAGKSVLSMLGRTRCAHDAAERWKPCCPG